MFAGDHRLRAKKASAPTTGPDAAGWAPGDPSRPSAEDPTGRHPSTLLDITPDESQAAPSTQLDSLLEFLPENPPGAGADRAPLQPPPESSLAMPTLVAPGQHPRSGAKSMDLEELRALLRQTELAIEQSKSEANVVGRNLLELRNISARLVRGYGVLEDACRQTERRSDKALETLVDIEARLGPLEIVRDLTNKTDDSLAVLRQLGEEVMQRSAVFQVQQESVDLALARVAETNALLATLDERVTTLTASDKLQQAEATVEHLARRAAEITASLERRASETTAALAGRIDGFDAQKAKIEQGLAEAARVTDLVASLDAHLATLTGPDQALAKAEARIESLQRHAAETTTGLEQRTDAITTALGERTAATTADLEQRAAGMIADLERRATGTTGELERRIERQKQAIAQALSEVARVTDLVSAVGAQVAALTEPDQALARAEARVDQLQSRAAETTASLEQRAVETAVSLEQRAANVITSLEQRAAETTSDLERRIGDFEAHEHRIGHTLAEAARFADLVAHLEAHLATLTGPDQALAQAGTTVERLQQRALEAVATLEQRAIDATASLERRAADTTTDLERRLDTFDVQKQAIVHALGEATRVTDLVAALEAHLVSLTGPDHELARAEARVGLLQAHAADAAAAFERRTAETIADLERRTEGFDAQQQTIAQALAEAARVTDLVAAVDVHVATLTGPNRDLAHAQAAVDDLERRAAAAATRLQHLARTNDDLELSITTTEQHLSTVRVAARGAVIRPATPYWPFVGGYAALVASAVLAVFVLRNPGPPAGTLNDARLPQRESAVAETSRPPAATVPASPLPPPTLPAEPVGAPPPASLRSASAAPRSGIPSASSPSPAQPAPVRQAAAPPPNAAPGQRPATTTERRGGPAARPARAIAATEKPGNPAASPQAVAATKDVKRFVGVLAVESVPTGAAVFINQQSVGQTPLNLPDVRAGTHAIRVEHAGYARWTAAVLVIDGKQTRINAVLQPIGPGPGANSGR